MKALVLCQVCRSLVCWSAFDICIFDGRRKHLEIDRAIEWDGRDKTRSHCGWLELLTSHWICDAVHKVQIHAWALIITAFGCIFYVMRTLDALDTNVTVAVWLCGATMVFGVLEVSFSYLFVITVSLWINSYSFNVFVESDSFSSLLFLHRFYFVRKKHIARSAHTKSGLQQIKCGT